MNTLNLQTKKVTKSTASQIAVFIYDNRNELSNDLKLFYLDVKGLLELQLRKSAERRMTMDEILERAFNIESYVLATGAACYNLEYMSL